MSENVTGSVLRDLWTGAAQTLRSYWTGPYSSRDPELSAALGYQATSTGVSVTQDTAMNFSAFWAAIAIISGDVASLPLVLYKRTPNGGKERYTDSSLYELLHDAPNAEMTSMVFRESVQAHAMSWGNGYAEIERNGANRPIALWPLTPDRATPFRQDRRLKYRVTNETGRDVILEAMNVLHIPGLGFDGTVGYSVVQKARESIGLGLAAERFGGTFFGNGSTFGGVLSFKQEKLTKEFKEGVRESLDKIHGGVDRAHKFIILGNEAKYEKLGIPPNDAQFLETRKFQITEIARWFQIPPHKLGDLERATFSNIEQQDIEYYRSCLRRWLVRWEQELTRKLIPSLERKQQFIKHNVEGFLRGDSAARSTFYREMFNIGAYSINMILESEDLNKIGPEGDVHFVQGNLLPADIAQDGPPKPLPPPPTMQQLGPVKDDEDDDEEQNALGALLTEIAGRTAAIQVNLATERDTAVKTAADLVVATTAQQAADAARVDAEQRAAEAIAARATAEAGAAEAAAALAALEANLAADRETVLKGAADLALATTAQQEADAARQQAEQRATDEATARATAEAAATEAAAALTALEQTETARRLGVIAAHRALIVDALGRMCRREAEKARAAQATPEKLRAWMERFYPLQAEMCRAALLPALRAHLAWMQAVDDPETVTAAIVQRHIDESQRQLRLVLGRDPAEFPMALETCVRRWEVERADHAADEILRDALAQMTQHTTVTEQVTPPATSSSVTTWPMPPVTVQAAPIHIDFHHHAAPTSRSVRFTRNVDGSIQSASIDDQED